MRWISFEGMLCLGSIILPVDTMASPPEKREPALSLHTLQLDKQTLDMLDSVKQELPDAALPVEVKTEPPELQPDHPDNQLLNLDGDYPTRGCCLGTLWFEEHNYSCYRKGGLEEMKSKPCSIVSYESLSEKSSGMRLKTEESGGGVGGCGWSLEEGGWGQQEGSGWGLARESQEAPPTRLGCPQHCGKLFNGGLPLKKHMARVHSPNYYCNHCFLSFRNKSSLKTHIKGVHGKLCCFHCNRSFRLRHALQRHVATAHPNKINFSCHYYRQRFSENPFTWPPHTQFQCFHCQLKFTNKSTLRAHIRIHEIKFTCHYCKERFKKKDDLMNHIVNIHCKTKQLMCSHCGVCFWSKSLLKKHIFKFHTTALRFACAKCSCSFKWESTLKVHLGVHQLEEDLARKMRDKPIVLHPSLKCLQCCEYFTSEHKLKLHLGKELSLAEKTCKQCSEKFLNLCKLRMHLISAHNRPMFFCSQCSRAYQTSSDLQKHYIKEHRDKDSIPVNEMRGKATKTNEKDDSIMVVRMASLEPRMASGIKMIEPKSQLPTTILVHRRRYSDTAPIKALFHCPCCKTFFSLANKTTGTRLVQCSCNMLLRLSFTRVTYSKPDKQDTEIVSKYEASMLHPAQLVNIPYT